jgi:hypothetical protein
VHNDQPLDYDGELIIKNKSHTSQHIIYTVFLLKTDKSILSSIIQNILPSNIDKLLQNPTESTYLEIQPSNQGQYLIYTDKSTNQTVIIDTNIIQIATDLSNYSKTQPLFRTSPHYDIVEKNKIQSTIEGFTLDTSGTLINVDPQGDYLVCDNLPIGSEEELGYVIPADSPIMSSLSNSSSIITLMNYFVIFMILIFAFLSSTFIYSSVFSITDTTSQFYWLSKKVFSEFSWLGIIGTCVSAVLFIIFVSVGLLNNPKIPMLTNAGLCILMAYIVGLLAIKNNTKLQETITANMHST